MSNVAFRFFNMTCLIPSKLHYNMNRAQMPVVYMVYSRVTLCQ